MKNLVLVGLAGAALAVAPFAQADDRCVETSDVIGHQACSRYGHGWSSESSMPLTIDVGLIRSTYGLTGRKFSIENTSARYRFEGPSAAAAYGYAVRLNVMASPFLYLGLEQSAAFGSVDGAFVASDTAAAVPAGRLFAMSLGLPVGLRLPLGKLSLRGEVYGGLTLLGFTGGAWFGGVVEGRGYLDLWLANDTTLSVLVGHDLLGRNDQRAGLVLTLHGRSFDGRYGF